MYGEGHSHSIVQCGLGEALACQEMRERTLAKPSMWTRCAPRSEMGWLRP
jgi:hypothetical protein